MKFCIYCGQMLDREDDYCPSCGSKVIREEESRDNNSNAASEDMYRTIRLGMPDFSKENDSNFTNEGMYRTASEGRYEPNVIKNERRRKPAAQKKRKAPAIIGIVVAVVLAVSTGGYFAYSSTIDKADGGKSKIAELSSAADADKGADGQQNSQAEDGTVVEEAGWYYVKNAKGSNADTYAKPDENSNVVGTIYSGNTIYTTKHTKDSNWYYAEDCGWIRSSALERIIEPDEIKNQGYSVDGTYVNTSKYADGIKVHPTPSKDSDVLFSVYEGEDFYVSFITNDNYGFISYGNSCGEQVGWFNMDYAEEGTSDEYQPYEPYEYYEVVVKNLKLREGPGTEYEIIDEDIGKGSDVYVYDTAIKGDYVWLDVGYGWVCAQEKSKRYIK